MTTTRTHSMHFVFTLALIFSALLSGCAVADTQTVQQIGFYNTLVGIRQAVAANPGTFLMESKDAVLAAWPSGSNYAFASFSKEGKPIMDLMEEIGMHGQKTDVFTMTSLTQYLEAHGWTYTTVDKLPAALLASLRSYAAVSLTESTQVFPTILIVPLSAEQMIAPSNGRAQ